MCGCASVRDKLSSVLILTVFLINVQQCSNCRPFCDIVQPSVANQIHPFQKDTFLRRQTVTCCCHSLTCVAILRSPAEPVEQH